MRVFALEILKLTQQIWYSNATNLSLNPIPTPCFNCQRKISLLHNSCLVLNFYTLRLFHLIISCMALIHENPMMRCSDVANARFVINIQYVDNWDTTMICLNVILFWSFEVIGSCKVILTWGSAPASCQGLWIGIGYYHDWSNLAFFDFWCICYFHIILSFMISNWNFILIWGSAAVMRKHNFLDFFFRYLSCLQSRKDPSLNKSWDFFMAWQTQPCQVQCIIQESLTITASVYLGTLLHRVDDGTRIWHQTSTQGLPKQECNQSMFSVIQYTQTITERHPTDEKSNIMVCKLVYFRFTFITCGKFFHLFKLARQSVGLSLFAIERQGWKFGTPPYMGMYGNLVHLHIWAHLWPLTWPTWECLEPLKNIKRLEWTVLHLFVTWLSL